MIRCASEVLPKCFREHQQRSPKTMFVPVEVLRRYSNQPDALQTLHDLLKRIEAGDREAAPGLPDYSTGSSGPWRVRDRLTEADLAAMIEQYRSGGVTKPALADQYNISLSTVKRILARHGVRKYPKPPR